MATLSTDLRYHPPAIIRPVVDVDFAIGPSPLGPDGLQLHRVMDAVNVGRQKLSQRLVAADLLDEAISYHRVPPKRSFPVAVQYVHRGRGKPRPYRLGD